MEKEIQKGPENKKITEFLIFKNIIKKKSNNYERAA